MTGSEPLSLEAHGELSLQKSRRLPGHIVSLFTLPHSLELQSLPVCAVRMSYSFVVVVLWL